MEFFHQDQEQNELLRTCEALKDHRVEIAAFFADHPDSRERGNYLKRFFGNTFVEQVISNGQRVGYRAYDDMFHMWRGAFMTREREVYHRWRNIADHIYGMILLEQWLAPNEVLLPTEEQQIAMIEQAEREKDAAFVLPQAAIDYVVARGSNTEYSKFRIYEHFGKGLTPAEKKEYAAYRRMRVLQEQRGQIADQFKSIVDDYNDFQEQLGNRDAKLNLYILSSCASEFTRGKKTTWTLTENNFILPLMRNAMETIIGQNTHLTERCLAMLDHLNSDLAKPMEPSYDELNPPPPPKMEYRFALGDTIYIGTQEYELLAIDDETVRLFDPAFPLFNKEMPREEFDEKVAENPRNDHLRHIVEEPAEIVEPPTEEEPLPIGRIEYLHTDGRVREQIEYTDVAQMEKDLRKENEYGVPMKVTMYVDRQGKTVPHRFVYEMDPPLHGTSVIMNPHIQGGLEKPMETAMRLIDEFCRSEYDSPADFSDLRRIGIGHTTVTDAEIPIQVNVDLVEFRLNRFMDGIAVDHRKYDTLEALIEKELESLNFDDLMDFPTAAPEPDIPQEVPLPPPAPKPREKAASTVLLPGIPDAERSSFRITDDDLGVGPPGQRYAANVAAIRLLKRLEAEERLATPEEQEVLSRYVGWGGLADCFEERHSKYAELKGLLTEEEYAAARESTLTAFYTPPVVIRAMYQALENMNFRNGNILEPSCGVGNFLGLLPDSMSGSKLYGVELDSVSGRIAQQLYQNSSIAVTGFEKVQMPDSFFDIAIGNVPFGDFKVNDKRYDKHHWLIHDYFFGATRS